MGEKNLWSKLLLIVALVGICAWYLWPPDERLNLGIDLRGGHSLIFEIDDSGLNASDKADLSKRVMEVLKNRVDPTGTRNLVWRPIGRNRLEIQMPKPPGDQKDNRDDYMAARQALMDTAISETQIRAKLKLPPDQAKAELDKMIGAYKSRATIIEALLGAQAKLQELQAQYDALDEVTTTQPTGEGLAAAADEARKDREKYITNLLETNVDVRMVEDMLERGRKDEIRIKQMQALHDRHPDLNEILDNLAEAYDRYASAKGTLDDPADLMRLLRGAGVLEFRILARPDSKNTTVIDSSNEAYAGESIQKYIDQLAKFGPRRQGTDPFQWFKLADSNTRDWDPRFYILADYAGDTYVLGHATEDMGLVKEAKQSWSLRSARPGRDEMGRTSIDFSLGGAGPKLFGALTTANQGRQLCIFLDNEAISAARINSPIYSRGQITGDFKPDYVNYVVRTLQAGSLPARLKETPLQQKSIGPALGVTNREKGKDAIKIGFLLTIAFMFVYYGYNGLIADIALLMNLVITLGVMSLLQATFTLPGIAGLVLTLGMAVDANVLIYERIREELSRGISVRMAVKLGYEKAFSAILDSNVTTILTAVILGSLGSEEIKGFGLTLGIGLCTSMFTALFVTRQFFHVMLPNSLNKEETNHAWIGLAVLVGIGSLIMGCGYAFVDPADRIDSSLFDFGQFLGWVAGTAVVLTACLIAFRLVYHGLGHQKANRLPMMRLFSAPNINWMGMYKIFWTISAVIIVAGLIFDASGDRKEYLDIEFIGGTNAEIALKSQHENLTDTDVRNHVIETDDDSSTSAVEWLDSMADELEQAKVTPLGNNRYGVETSKDLTPEQLEALLLPTFENHISLGGIAPADRGVTVDLKEVEDEAKQLDEAGVRNLVVGAADYARKAAKNLGQARIQMIETPAAEGDQEQNRAFEIITPEPQQKLVSEALVAAMGDLLEVMTPLSWEPVTNPVRADEDAIFPIPQSANTLGDVIGGDSIADVGDYKGGVAMVFDQLDPPQTVEQVKERVALMRQHPDFQDQPFRKSEVFGLEFAEGSDTAFSKIAVVAVDSQILYATGEDNSQWDTAVAGPELTLTEAALKTSRSLRRVTKFEGQVAQEATTKAIIAIILSLIAIAAYLWVRFGSVQFGLAGIIALFHDVAVTLSCVMACHVLVKTPIGPLLGLSDFRIDLAMIAAFLTIVGYSINDSIVIFDRIRENRGRLATVSADLINDSINQTLSRTLITSLTTFMVVVVMYLVGGEGIHGFAFAMIVGVVSGTYSTIAIATPMLNHPRAMSFVATLIVAVVLVGLIWLGVSSMTAKVILIGIVAALALAVLVRQQLLAGANPGR